MFGVSIKSGTIHTVRTVPVYGGSLAKSQFLDYVLSRARLE